ncbi:MAG: ROK family protein [Anaerolineales bacterium]
MFSRQGPIGIGFPAPIKNGIPMMAANVSQKWVGINADELFSTITGSPCKVGNDADVAGLAEMKFGAGKDHPGTVIMITLGTGIGTAIFYKGSLLPNTEFGHLGSERPTQRLVRPMQPVNAMTFPRKNTPNVLTRYLSNLENFSAPTSSLLAEELAKNTKNLFSLDVQAKVVPAQFQNEAGIVGAALFGQ